MKAWVLTVIKRIGDLVVKAIAMKSVAAVVVTYVALANKDPGATVIVAVMWSLVVGFRFAEKAVNLWNRKEP